MIHRPAAVAVGIAVGITGFIGIGAHQPAPAAATGASIDRTPGTPGTPRGGELRRMTVIDQDIELGVQDTFDITVQLPADLLQDDLDATSLGTDASFGTIDVQVVAYAPLERRTQIDSIRAGDGSSGLTPVEDTFGISLMAADADPHVTRPTPDRLGFSVPVEAANTDAALQLSREGVYPLTFSLRIDGEPVADVVTFVHRHSAAESPIGDLPVALFIGQTSTPTISPDQGVVALDGTTSTPTMSSAEHDDLQRLTESLEAIDATAVAAGAAQPNGAGIPRAVLVQPASLQALRATDPALADRLVAVLGRGQVLSAPSLPLEPSAIARVGRDEIYSTWLRDGEGILTDLVPNAQPDRELYFPTSDLSESALAELARLGLRALVLTPDAYATTEGSIADYGDPTWLQTIELSDGSTVKALRIDPAIGARLDESPADPLRAAVDLVAEVLTLRQFLDGQGRTVSRLGLLLARSDGSPIDPTFASELTRLLVQVDGVRLESPSDMIATMDSQFFDGSLGTLTLPASAGDDLTQRFATIDALNFESPGVKAMLPDGDPHLFSWDQMIGVMPTSALTDEQVAAMAAQIRGQFDAFRTGVVAPNPFAFTLTGRTGSIVFRLRNTTDVALKVIVRLSATKMTFPENDKLITLAPQSQTPVSFEAETKSNGTSQVILRVLTPNGNQIIPDVALTAQVRALTGLGPLLTGAGLLVLATWWVRHWRLTRRKRGAIGTTDRHPVARPPRASQPSGGRPAPDDQTQHDLQTDSDLQTDGEALSPDAAASSLPPS